MTIPKLGLWYILTLAAAGFAVVASIFLTRKLLHLPFSRNRDIKRIALGIAIILVVILFDIPFLSIVLREHFRKLPQVERATDWIRSAMSPNDTKSYAGICKDVAQSICYKGEITDDGFARLKLAAHTMNPPPQKLFINSPGGYVDAGKGISELVERFDLTVKVASDRTKHVDCGSACVSVLAAAKSEKQDVDPDAKIMIHMNRFNVFAPGPILQMLIVACEHYYSICQESANVALFGGRFMSDSERNAQLEAASKLQKNGSQLRKALESCNPSPTTTLKGITLSWSQIGIIEQDTGPIMCPFDRFPLNQSTAASVHSGS